VEGGCGGFRRREKLPRWRRSLGRFLDALIENRLAAGDLCFLRSGARLRLLKFSVFMTRAALEYHNKKKGGWERLCERTRKRELKKREKRKEGIGTHEQKKRQARTRSASPARREASGKSSGKREKKLPKQVQSQKGKITTYEPKRRKKEDRAKEGKSEGKEPVGEVRLKIRDRARNILKKMLHQKELGGDRKSGRGRNMVFP